MAHRLQRYRGSARVHGCVLLLAVALASGCSRETERQAAQLTGGDPGRGKVLLTRYGCASCHTIPGIRGADAHVGPPLAKMARRSYIGGVIENTPENMIYWIRNPQGVDSLSAMPNLGVSVQDARDIAGYLYTLR